MTAESMPENIKRFLSKEGVIHHWPAKVRKQKLFLPYLVGFFEFNRSYSEAEVNRILEPHAAIDAATLRRMLCDYGFLDRDSWGHSYWRCEQD